MKYQHDEAICMQCIEDEFLRELVFEKRDFQPNDASAGWNGTYKGLPAKPDVYVYQLDVFCNNGETVRLNGNIALMR